VLSIELATHQNRQNLPCANWPEGFYNVVLQGSDGTTAAQRLVVKGKD